MFIYLYFKIKNIEYQSEKNVSDFEWHRRYRFDHRPVTISCTSESPFFLASSIIHIHKITTTTKIYMYSTYITYIKYVYIYTYNRMPLTSYDDLFLSSSFFQSLSTGHFSNCTFKYFFLLISQEITAFKKFWWLKSLFLQHQSIINSRSRL